MRRLLILLIYTVSLMSCDNGFDDMPVDTLNNPEHDELDSLSIDPFDAENGSINIGIDSMVNEYEFEIHI